MTEFTANLELVPLDGRESFPYGRERLLKSKAKRKPSMKQKAARAIPRRVYHPCSDLQLGYIFNNSFIAF